SEADVETARRFDDAALVPLTDVVDFDGHVGVGEIRRAEDERVAIEYSQWEKARGHPELGVVVLVSREHRQILRHAGCPHPVRRLAVEPTQPAGDVRRDPRNPLDGVVQLAGVADGDVRERPSRLETPQRVASVDVGDAYGHVESPDLEAALAAPDARAER